MFNKRFTFRLLWWYNVSNLMSIRFRTDSIVLYILILLNNSFCIFSHEAMTDLIGVMSTLVDSHGRILIDGIYDEVAPLLPEEEKLYQAITFDTVCLNYLFELNEFYFIRKLIVLKLGLKKQFKIIKNKF